MLFYFGFRRCFLDTPTTGITAHREELFRPQPDELIRMKHVLACLISP